MRYFLVLIGIFFLFGAPTAKAIYDPLSVPNNKVGIHILTTNEVDQAAKLVNSSGGDWGYVTIPLQSTDRDREKWTEFFLKCRQNHLIPIIRLSTYFADQSWVTPNANDLVDFANFLNEMPWPVKNRYIIIFNEPNHAAEWGGQVNPFEYATLLIQAKNIFKSRSQDFFILSAGLDMSVPNSNTSMDALKYYRLMTQAQPDWPQTIDGLSAHAYPNPGFISSVFAKNRFSVKSYLFEQQLLLSFGVQPKPIFITETGTIKPGDFFTPGYTQVWTEPNIVTITPFLLFAGAGQFTPFSLLDERLQPKASYSALANLTKSRGSPLLSTEWRPSITYVSDQSSQQTTYPTPDMSVSARIKNFFNPKQSFIFIGETQLKVEVAATPQSQAQGLSDRPSLPPDTGMLFIFPQVNRPPFWMKDMHFPLDFVWIKGDSVVQINENIPPPAQTDGQPQFIYPLVDVDKVLEVNAGFIQEHGVKVGDKITFEL